MKKLVIIPILLCSLATAQEQVVRTGPFGSPIMVADEGGAMRDAILVYENHDIGYLIPDITSSAWRFWFIPGFQKTGKYFVPLYTWYKTTNTCIAWPHPPAENQQWMRQCADLGFQCQWVTVDVRNQAVHIEYRFLVDKDGMSDITTRHPVNIDKKLSETSKPFQAAIQHITKIVENESKGGRGE